MTIQAVRSALVCVVCTVARLAVAEPGKEQAEADRLFEEGREFAKNKRWVEACDRFDRSFLIDPTPGTTLNLADCREHLGELRKASQLFDAAADKLANANDEKRAQFARERRDAILKRSGTVIVKPGVPPQPGLEITVAGHAVPANTGEVRELVEPGRVEVVARAPKKQPFVHALQIESGTTSVVVIPPLSEPELPDPARRRNRLLLAYGLAGGAGVAAIASTLLTLKARSDYNATAGGEHCAGVLGGITCDDIGERAIADAQRKADIGTGVAVASGLLVVAAAVVYVTAPKVSVGVAPALTATGGEVTIRVRF